MATGTTELLTPEDVAARLRIRESLVRRYCQQGRIGRKIGDRWFITPEELREFRKIPRHPGRPKS